jgi:TolA-binding protein
LALVRLGEALLLENRPAEALQQFTEAINVAPADSSAYRGRILASQAHLELNDTAAAEKLLLDNLSSELLTPASLEWRDSLFALGRLYCLTNRYAEAIERLEEAVRRYPQAAEAINARYLIGESYRQLARESLSQRDAALVESARNVHAREANRCLEGAIAAYDATAQELETRRQTSQADQVVLRNCRYMKAAALFDMGRYGDAAQAYSTAINHYQHAPEVLDAYVRVADCFRRLHRPLEARGTIEQAKMVLGRMPENADFSQTSSFDRQEWRQYLDWLGTL